MPASWKNAANVGGGRDLLVLAQAALTSPDRFRCRCLAQGNLDIWEKTIIQDDVKQRWTETRESAANPRHVKIECLCTHCLLQTVSVNFKPTCRGCDVPSTTAPMHLEVGTAERPSSTFPWPISGSKSHGWRASSRDAGRRLSVSTGPGRDQPRIGQERDSLLTSGRCHFGPGHRSSETGRQGTHPGGNPSAGH